MEGTSYYDNIGRMGLNKLRADGQEYSNSIPYVPRPLFTSPAILAFYSDLPIWGSVNNIRFASDFTPLEAWIGNDRYMRILCRAEKNREQEGSQAELIVDLLHKLGIFYTIHRNVEPSPVRIEAHKVTIQTNGSSPEIVENYAGDGPSNM